MDGKKNGAAGLPLVTAGEWFAGGQRVVYDPGSAHVLTEEEAAAAPGRLQVFERVAAAEADTDAGAVWLTMLPGFPDGRIDAVARELRSGRVPGARLTVQQAQELIMNADGPAAFYKDANPRNFLITPEGTLVTIDFDDLTLAPFGYDLAKLVVTLAMTHGPVPAVTIAAALTSYNKAASRHSRSLPGVTWEELTGWAEIHHILTSRYADDGRYPCRWDQARPGPAPEEASPWP